MALKTPPEKAPASPKPDRAPAASAPDVIVANTTVLELALYNLYTWQGDTYERGKPYRFKNSDALILLGEQDLGRPIWRIFRPATKKEARNAQQQEVVDATLVKATRPTVEMAFGRKPSDKIERIDVGDDSEIADILNATDEGEPEPPTESDGGDVTV